MSHTIRMDEFNNWYNKVLTIPTCQAGVLARVFARVKTPGPGGPGRLLVIGYEVEFGDVAVAAVLPLAGQAAMPANRTCEKGELGLYPDHHCHLGRSATWSWHADIR